LVRATRDLLQGFYHRVKIDERTYYLEPMLGQVATDLNRLIDARPDSRKEIAETLAAVVVKNKAANIEFPKEFLVCFVNCDEEARPFVREYENDITLPADLTARLRQLARQVKKGLEAKKK
jgi:hypothetical protein